MKECRPEAVEALVTGELDAAEAARVAAHVEGCAACSEERRWLARERRLFAARAAARPGPPPFEAVLAAMASAEARPVEAMPARPAPRATDAIRALRQSTAQPTARRGGSRRGEGRAPRSRGAGMTWMARGVAAAAALTLGAALFAWPSDPAQPPLRAEPITTAPTPAIVPTEACYACASEPAPAPALLVEDDITVEWCDVGVTCDVCEPQEE